MGGLGCDALTGSRVIPTLTVAAGHGTGWPGTQAVRVDGVADGGDRAQLRARARRVEKERGRFHVQGVVAPAAAAAGVGVGVHAGRGCKAKHEAHDPSRRAMRRDMRAGMWWVRPASADHQSGSESSVCGIVVDAQSVQPEPQYRYASSHCDLPSVPCPRVAGEGRKQQR